MRRLVRIERHRNGPRVYILSKRVHEVHLGLLLLAFVLAATLSGWQQMNGLLWGLLFAGCWMVIKDARDLIPSQRDTGCWSLGFHRRVPAHGTVSHFHSVPLISAVVSALLGALNILSALTPNIRWRQHELLAMQPVSRIPLFHALALPAGALLLVVAFYLGRRRQRAYVLALAVLAATAIINMLKGLDYEEASLSLAAMALLWAGRRSFYVRHDGGTLKSAVGRVVLLVAGTVAITAAIVLIASPQSATALLILRESGDLLLWQQGPIHFTDELRRLPLGIELMTVIGFLSAATLVFRPLAMPLLLPDRRVRTLVTEIVRRHGEDTLAFFKLRGDLQYLVSEDGAAFLGYRIEAGVLLVAGDPVGPAEALPGLLRQAIELARRSGLKIGALGAGEKLLPLYEQLGLRSIYIGDEAIVDTAAFSLEGRPIRKVRQSVTRLEKAGYRSELLDLSSAKAKEIEELRELSQRWLQGQDERGFSMAMDSIDPQAQPDTFCVIARDEEGAIRGFLHFVPAYRRPAVSLSVMRRDRETPNGLTEFLVVKAIELFRERGVEEVLLNFAAFARYLHAPASVWERLLAIAIRRFNPYFQIESLYRFNVKFFPRWESRYLVYEDMLHLPRLCLAVLWLEGQIAKPALPAARRRTCVPS